MDKREIADLSNIKDNVAFHFYVTDKVWYIGVLEMLFWTGRHFFFFFHVFLKMINAWGKEIKVTGNCLQFPADGAKVRLIMYLRLLSHSAVTKLWLCDPMACCSPDSSVHGILQARGLERVAMPSSRGSSQSRDRTRVTCIAGGFFTTEPPGKPLCT